MAQQTLNLPREQTHQRIADALEDIVDKIVDTSSADNIDYDNTTSGLSANKVQSAIDELALAGFVTNTVNNLVNYYLKSETYNKTEVDSLINAVKNSRFEAVSTLPTTNIKTNVIYLVPKSPTQTNNAKDEYINLDGTSSGWEKIGDTEVDLSGYVTTTALNTALSNYTTTANLTKLLDDKVDKVSGKGLSTNDYTTADKNKLMGIEAEANKTVVDSAMSDSSTNPLQNKVITKELEGTKTATGNPLTVSDAAPVNAVNLSMDLEPIQDLHGYDHPWVGGAGKNKLPLTVEGIKINNQSGVWNGNIYTYNGITFTILTDSDGNVTGIKVNGTSSAVTRLPLTTGYIQNIWKGNIVSGVNGGSTNTYFINCNLSNNGSTWETEVDVSNGEKTISNYDYIEVAIFIRANTTLSNVIFYPMIRLSTETDSSFAPYSNICPISGRSEIDIDRVGKNLFNQNYYNNSTLWSRVTYSSMSQYFIYAPLPSNFPRKFSATSFLKTSSAISDCVIGFATSTDFANGSAVKRFVQGGVNTTTDFDFTGEDNLYLILGKSSGNIDATTYPSTVFSAYNVMITLPNRDLTTYQPYKGKTYTIQLGDTIYGGELYVLTGELRVTRKCVDLGSLNFTYDENQRFTIALSDMKRASIREAHFITSCYLTIDDGRPYSQVTDFSAYAGWGGTAMMLSIHDSRYSDAATYKTAIMGQTICYELATPYTIQLTPEQIKLLENINTISTDYEGDTITIEYQPNNAIGEAVRVVEESYDAELEYLKPTGSISSGDTKAVTGGVVYDYHNTTPLNPKANLYIEKSGNVINIEAIDVDGSAFTSYPGAGGYTLPTGYRPKRILIVCVYVYTTYDNKRHHGIIKIRDDGTMDGYFIDFSGNEHRIYDSSYSSSVSFNTSYIV